MRVWFRVASVTILPLAVLAAGVMFSPRLRGGPPVSFDVLLFSAAINLLIFAAPQLLWLLIALLGRFTSRVCDAGLAATDAILIFFCVLVSAQSDTDAGILWLGYLPLAVVASLLIGGIARLSARKV